MPNSASLSPVAHEIAALLERLEIPALVRDAQGGTVAVTDGGDAALLRRGGSDVREVTVRIAGESLAVVMDAREPVAPAALTARQRTIAELLALGLRNREIAERLAISEHTVRRHVESVLSRLRVHSRAQAARALGASPAAARRAPEARPAGPPPQAAS